jgi:HlyD family secretion protein
VPKPARKRRLPVWLLVVACIVALGGAGVWYWWQLQLNALPPGIAKANGRLEAEQTEISTKYPGRIALVLAKATAFTHLARFRVMQRSCC